MHVCAFGESEIQLRQTWDEGEIMNILFGRMPADWYALASVTLAGARVVCKKKGKWKKEKKTSYFIIVIKQNKNSKAGWLASLGIFKKFKGKKSWEITYFQTP